MRGRERLFVLAGGDSRPPIGGLLMLDPRTGALDFRYPFRSRRYESVMGAIPGNIEFGLNMIDWLVQDDALLAIRAKKVEPRSLRPTPEGIRPWIKYGNMIGPVLLVMLFGLVRWRRRKNRQIVYVKRET